MQHVRTKAKSVILLPQSHDQSRKQWHDAGERLRALYRACHPSAWHWQGSITPAELLGLAERMRARLVRYATRDHDGQARLRITLRRSSPPAPVPPMARAPQRQLTILLVEPQRGMRRALTRLFQQARIAVLPVAEGRNAKEALQTAARAGVRFHVLVVNARLRDTTSMVLVRELRLLVPNVPILLVCSPRMPLPCGWVSHTTPVLPLVKPLSWSQLASGLERAVGAVYPGESILMDDAAVGAPDRAATDGSAELPADATSEPPTAGERDMASAMFTPGAHAAD